MADAFIRLREGTSPREGMMSPLDQMLGVDRRELREILNSITGQNVPPDANFTLTHWLPRLREMAKAVK